MINLNLGIGGKRKMKEDGEKKALIFSRSSVKHSNLLTYRCALCLTRLQRCSIYLQFIYFRELPHNCGSYLKFRLLMIKYFTFFNYSSKVHSFKKRNMKHQILPACHWMCIICRNRKKISVLTGLYTYKLYIINFSIRWISSDLYS